MVVFTGIGAAVFGAGTFLATVTAGALQVAAGIALSYIAKAIAGEPEGPKFGVQARLQGGDDVPRSILFGYHATAGSFVYGNTWGTANGVPNAYLTQVIALADYPMRELVGVEVNSIPDTLGTMAHPAYGFPILGFRKNGVDHAWVKFYDGSQTTADSFLVGTVSSTQRPYDSTRVGFGVPYVIVTTMAPERRDGEENPLFNNGTPRFKFVGNGSRLYDISRDSSAGGVGTQRWNDPSTWGGDGDFLPAVQIYNILRGMRYGNQWLYGLQSLPEARLPAANWIAAIEKCRASIEGPDGLEPSYRSGGELQVGAQITTALESLLTACQGRLTEIGGVYKLHVGEPGTAVMSFTDAEIISTQEQMFTPFYGLEDTINGIQATYPNPFEGWNTKTAPPLIRTDLEALDGNRRLMASVSLDLVPYAGQVQRLMLFALREAQRARRHTFVMGPEFWVLEPGDVIQWTSARNGYVTKLFRVDGMADQAGLDVMLDLTEVDPSDYSWDQDEDFTPVVDGPLQLVGTPPMPMIGWQVFGVPVLDDMGRSRRPGIEVWYQSGLQGVREVRVQVRVPGATNPFLDLPPIPYGAPWRTQLAGNFPPNTQYEVRGIFVMEAGGEAEWSAWLDVTTPNVLLTPGLDFDPFAGVTDFENLGPGLAGWINWMGLSPRELMEAIQDGSTHAADQEVANSGTFQQIRTELSVSIGTVQAQFLQVVTVAIVPLQNEVAALADWLTELSAGNGSDVSTARFRMTALSGPSGYSRIGAETRVDTADPNAWRGAAWFLDTPTNPALPTRFLVRADQFVVANNDDSNVASPLIFDAGGLRVNDAMVRNASIGNLEVGTAKIADLAITTAKIANLAVGSAQIDALAVTSAKIGDLQVDTIKIANGAVTAAVSQSAPNGTVNFSTPHTISLSFASYTTGVIQVTTQFRIPSHTFTSPQSFPVVCTLRRGATVLRQESVWPQFRGTGDQQVFLDNWYGFAFIDTSPTPGAVSYTLQLTCEYIGGVPFQSFAATAMYAKK